MNYGRQRGIALVLTLIMLAVVTAMAIIFLALARRERAAVVVSEDLGIAKYMADAAAERAKAQAIAQMSVAGSKLSYDLFVSTNFYNYAGFQPQNTTVPDPMNVSYTYANGRTVSGDDLLQTIANLQYDARVPVFVATNQNGGQEFRYYLDFDRNGVPATNGLLPAVDSDGQIIPNSLDRYVGDPEWIGILERPDQPHSETNRFIGRMAYIALPAGKTLSLNHIHNQAHPGGADDISSGRARSGFTRNQGYGSWEINLAAFLRELNTNNYAWPSNSYFFTLPTQPGIAPTAQGTSWDDAMALLSFRYNRNRNTLLPAAALFSDNAVQFTGDRIDNYGDGPYGVHAIYQVDSNAQTQDDPSRPWPGSPNTNAIYDVQQLFTLGDYSVGMTGFTNRLRQATRIAPQKESSYDRYTFYRLLSQMGVDATPNLEGKVHLGYSNTVGQVSTNLVPWTDPTDFFMKAADAMLKASIVENVIPIKLGNRVTSLYTNYVIGDTPVRPNISITNIQLYHTPPAGMPYATSNEYSASIHRILQVAANIWDNMTNRWVEVEGRNRDNYLPTVFRPLFERTATNFIIRGFTEVTNLVPVRNPFWYTLGQIATNGSIPVNDLINIYGQPWIIGAKKGHPNFNEVSVESAVQITRKLQLSRPNPSAPPNDTNVLYSVSVDNIWGLEAWNSYLEDYPRPLALYADISSFIVLSNNFGTFTNAVRFGTNYVSISTNYPTPWIGTAPDITQVKPGNYRVPIYASQNLLKDAAWLTFSPYFETNLLVAGQLFRDLHEPPKLQLYTTNRVRFWLVDMQYQKVVDFVNLDNLRTVVNLENLLAATNSAATEQFADPVPMNDQILWDATLIGGPGTATVGITNQIAVSSGNPEVSDSFWDPYITNPEDNQLPIDRFRKFLGLPLLYHDERAIRGIGLEHQTPFNPSRKFYVRFSWGANDPLVHYTPVDLQPSRPDTVDLTPNEPVPLDPFTGFSGNLGRLNVRYEPWGGAASDPSGTRSFQLSLKDPGIWGSDSWNFPILASTNNWFRFPSIGWLGQVHRGTPWQTLYLKGVQEDPKTWPRTWTAWAGSYGTRPTQDYKLLDAFTVAPTEEAASGLLSVNQTNRAAWSAVLSGLPVTVVVNEDPISEENPPEYGQVVITPATPEIQWIVDSLNQYRRVATLRTNWIRLPDGTYTNRVVANGVFESMGEILGAPGLTVNSPYLWRATNGVANPAQRIQNHRNRAWTDTMVEEIPMQIMSLIQTDEPRFVVYAFGQSLAPAPRSMATTAAYYGLITNYQITGEVVTKTKFRVEGELNNPANPLRAVVEEYKQLPPPE